MLNLAWRCPRKNAWNRLNVIANGKINCSENNSSTRYSVRVREGLLESSFFLTENPYYRAGKLAEIYEYCKRDVDTARQVYPRLTFAKSV